MTETDTALPSGPSPANADVGAPAAEPHPHDHAAEQRAHQLSMQCWRGAQRARTTDDWRAAIEPGRAAIELTESPEPRFNLAFALMGLAWAESRPASLEGQAASNAGGEPAADRASDEAISARRAAAEMFDEGRRLADGPELVRYATSAVALLGKRAELEGEPAHAYALGTHLTVLGKAVRARRALTAAAADPTLAELASAALTTVPEPVVVRTAPVGRNDPCPCGSGKKYKRCHGA